MPVDHTSANVEGLQTIPLLVNGVEEHTTDTFAVISPYTNTVCWNASSATPAHATRIVESAAAAFPSWAATKPFVRRDILLKAADILESRTEDLSSYMRTEMGANVGASQFFVVPLAIRMLRDVAARISSIGGTVPVLEEEGYSGIIQRLPMGVILGIVPWNAPYVFGIRSAACALAGGNTTIIKGSELTPRCYFEVGKAFLEAGLPPGCLNVVSCGPETAPSLVETMVAHDAVRKINFTGSTAVGRKIAALCGKYLKPTLMELGGKNSAIICEDADVELAAGAVVAGSYLNSGQICMATDRVLVHRRIAPSFIEAFHKAAREFVSTMDSTPTLVNAAAKVRVEKLIADAVSSGAKIEFGSIGSDSAAGTKSGVRLAPLLVRDVKEESGLWQEESFASVAAYRIVDTDEEAVGIANSGRYGLSATIFSNDLRKALALAKHLESGAVHINSMTIHDEPMLPHGGVKNSGWGRFNAKEGLEEFLVTKSITWKD